jgi:hypothetical protein
MINIKKKIISIIRPRYRYYLIKNGLIFLKGLFLYYNKQRLTKAEKVFARHLSFFKPKTTLPEDGILLVQMVKDYEYTIKLAAASKIIAEKNNLRVNFYDPYINAIDYRNDPPDQRKYKEICDKYEQNSLAKIYKSFAQDWMFSNSVIFHDQEKVKRALNNILEMLRQKGIEAILTIHVDGVFLGDLIYDTYLRLFHQPTISEMNDSIAFVIECALNLFYSFGEWVKHHKIKCLVNTYTAYLHHGIPVRICLHNNIEVITTGSSSYILQKLSKDYPYHSVNHTHFSPSRKLTKAQLEIAKQKLTSRFEGEIDPATSYMRKSAYSLSNVTEELKNLFDQKSRNIVLYAHDFYDSPHVNRKLEFPDFYQWLKGTLSVLTEIEDTSVFIKIHPNGIIGCKEELIKLVTSFNKRHFHILDESISNHNIVALKPDLIATARGTIGIEMAYFQIPTVALFDNIYANFNFVHTSYSRENYFSILKGEEQPVIDYNKENIYSFYYQAYIEKAGTSKNSVFNILISHAGDTYTSRYLELINNYSKDIFCNNFLQHYETSYQTYQAES